MRRVPYLIGFQEKSEKKVPHLSALRVIMIENGAGKTVIVSELPSQKIDAPKFSNFSWDEKVQSILKLINPHD